jgi:hypothetical protein
MDGWCRAWGGSDLGELRMGKLMIRWVGAGLAGALVLAASAAPAWSQTAGDAAAKWGLLGEWKLDCKLPTGPNSMSIEFAVRDGKLYQERNSGAAKDSTAITSAVIRSDGTLETTEVSSTQPPTTRQIVRRKQGDGRFAVWSNRAAGTEQYSIRDGKFVNGGGVAPALTRCRAATGKS